MRRLRSLKNDPEPDSDESSDDGSSEDMPEDSAGEGVQSPSRKRRSLDDGGKSPIKRKRFDDDVRDASFWHIHILIIVAATSSSVERAA